MCGTTGIIEEHHSINDEDKAFMTLYSMTDKFACLVGKKRKEATQQEKRQLAKQFLEAKKAECQSWIDNKIFDLVDVRRNFGMYFSLVICGLQLRK